MDPPLSITLTPAPTELGQGTLGLINLDVDRGWPPTGWPGSDADSSTSVDRNAVARTPPSIEPIGVCSQLSSPIVQAA